jgi:hypothetical protein
MMTRQLLLRVLYFFSVSAMASSLALAELPRDNTLVIPSPKEEKVEIKEEPKTYDLEKHDFLIEKSAPQVPRAPVYHLEPRPSLTLALSRALEVKDANHGGWIGVRIAPWMTATLRTEFGLDVRNDQGWITAALHSLPTRNLYRLYWGGGVSNIFYSRDELRPLLRIKNYYVFAAAGWELQLLENQNVRFEVSYHQGTKLGYARATLGYTFLF